MVITLNNFPGHQKLHCHYLREFQYISETLGYHQEGMNVLLDEGPRKQSCQSQGPSKVLSGKQDLPELQNLLSIETVQKKEFFSWTHLSIYI